MQRLQFIKGLLVAAIAPKLPEHKSKVYQKIHLEVVFRISEIPKSLSRSSKAAFRGIPKFTIGNEKYYSMRTDAIYTLFYDLWEGKYIRDDEGRIRLKRFFRGKMGKTNF